MAQSESTLLLKIKSTGDEVLSKTADALKALGKLAVAAFADISAAVAASVHAYKEQEEATNALNQALISQGIYSKSLSTSYQKMASDLQLVTTFADENIIAAEATLQQYLGQEKVTKELTVATLDFATAMGMDLKSAAEVIGKSIGTNTNALARYGISVDENVQKSLKMSEVTRGLEARFGGQAVAAAQGLGSLSVMKNALGELMEAAGARFAPVMIYAATQMIKFSQSLQDNAQMIDGFEQSAIILGKAGIFIKETVIGLGETVGAFLGTVTVALQQLAGGSDGDTGGGFWAAVTSMKDGFTNISNGIARRYGQFQKEISDIDQIFVNQRKKEDEQELVRSQANAIAKVNIDKNLILTQEQMFAARDRNEIVKLLAQEQLKSDQHLQSLNKQIARETDQTKKLNLEMEKRQYLDDAYADYDRKRLLNLSEFKQNMNSKAMSDFNGVLSDMAAMQQSKSGVLVAIGKAAAMAQIAIHTAEGAVKAFDFVASFGGPVAGGIAAAPIIAYGLEQEAHISGIQLAEGGIVKATPGGVVATIGEGGQDEAVIPLDRGQGPIFGSKINMTVYGGFLGSETQAREFAKAVDKELLKLRRGNESLAFDKGII